MSPGTGAGRDLIVQVMLWSRVTHCPVFAVSLLCDELLFHGQWEQKFKWYLSKWSYCMTQDMTSISSPVSLWTGYVCCCCVCSLFSLLLHLFLLHTAQKKLVFLNLNPKKTEMHVVATGLNTELFSVLWFLIGNKSSQVRSVLFQSHSTHLPAMHSWRVEQFTASVTNNAKIFNVKTVIQFSKSSSKWPFIVSLLVSYREPEEATGPSNEAHG